MNKIVLSFAALLIIAAYMLISTPDDQGKESTTSAAEPSKSRIQQARVEKSPSSSTVNKINTNAPAPVNGIAQASSLSASEQENRGPKRLTKSRPINRVLGMTLNILTRKLDWDRNVAKDAIRINQRELDRLNQIQKENPNLTKVDQIKLDAETALEIQGQLLEFLGEEAYREFRLAKNMALKKLQESGRVKRSRSD